MLAPEVLCRVDAYWAGFLGCTPQHLCSPEPVVLTHAAALEDYAGIYILQRPGTAPLLSLPAPLLCDFGARLAAAATVGLDPGARWTQLLGPRLERIIGPAWIGYTDAQTLYPATDMGEVRPLSSADCPALERLRQACTPTEWEHGGSRLGEHRVVGAFTGDELAAIAGYEIWGESIAHLSVLTHPASRGQGFGRAVVRAAAALALAGGLIPQYRTLAANAPSRAIAASLGFEFYATSLALRLFAVSPA